MSTEITNRAAFIEWLNQPRCPVDSSQCSDGDLDIMFLAWQAAIEHFLSATGQYVTNDATREATIQAAVEADRQQRGEPVNHIEDGLAMVGAVSAQPAAIVWRDDDGESYIEFVSDQEFESGTELYAAPVAAQAQPVVNQQMTNAARDVLAERQRQVEAEGWTTEHDDSHHTGEMALAAGCYAMYAHHPDYYGTGPREHRVPRMWSWAEKWWKQAPPRRMLVKAGALILAEIERIDRAAARAAKEQS